MQLGWLLGLAAALCAPGNSAIVDVTVSSNVFTPQFVIIQPGDTVHWTWTGLGTHSVTADDASFDSGFHGSGFTYDQTFNTPGVVGYHCKLHGAPNTGMYGRILVTGGGTTDVLVQDDFYEPQFVTVKQGEKVRWTWAGKRLHSVTEDNFAFDSGLLSTGATFEVVFNTVGTTGYFCTVHGDVGVGQYGTVTVEASGPEKVVPSAASVLKGTWNSGDLESFVSDDDNYYVVGAQYDPTDPLAVINATVRCDGNASAGSYSSGKLLLIEKCTTTQAKYRVRAIKSSGGFATLLDNVPTGFAESSFDLALPNPVSDFIDAANGNRLRVDTRAASNNKLAGFFIYRIDLLNWVLTP
jgi:plastocyanin